MGKGTDIDEAIGNMEHIIKICEECKKNTLLQIQYATIDPGISHEDMKKIDQRMKETALIAIKRIIGFLGLRDEMKHTFYPIKKKGSKYIHLKIQNVEKIVGYSGNYIEFENGSSVHEDYFNEFYRLVDDEV